MRAMLALILAGALMACARRVEVNTAPTTAQVSLHVTNNASQAMNIYVTSGGSDTFVGQVAANSTADLSVSGIAAGTSVTLKARTADGTRTYTKDGVMLSGSTSWTVP